ncbi:MAG: hypothetical protein QW058_03095 [Candidatus Aenigmatarchaeota archaeon]
MFESLLSRLYDTNYFNLKEELSKAHENLSKIFKYSASMPEIKLTNFPKIFRYIIDPLRGIVYKVVVEIGGAFDKLRNRIYLNIDKIKEKSERIPFIYHELTHKFLERFNLPRDVEEGYASWLTKKLTGYAKDAYGNLRERFERVYRKLGDKVFNPSYRNEIINTFYGLN